jgi:hypothetical protein
MNEKINWDDAPEGFDLHVKMKCENYLVNSFVKNLEDYYYSLPNGWILNASLCHQHGIVTERPSQEKESEEEPSPLMDEDSLQGQLSNIGDLLHNLSCSMVNEDHQDVLGAMSSKLWEMSKLYRQTPEQKLRAKVWNVVAETNIRKSDIDSITTDILEKFKLEEK